MRHKFLISTGCCPEADKHKVVKLGFNIDYGNFIPYNKLKPVWKAMGFNNFLNYPQEELMEMSVEVRCCPFCSKPTPEIEINQYAVENHKIHETDEDYCITCNERNMCCTCLPPEFRWKPIGCEVTIPIIAQNESDE